MGTTIAFITVARCGWAHKEWQLAEVTLTERSERNENGGGEEDDREGEGED